MVRSATTAESLPQPMAEPAGRLLVGWDGSRPSVAALHWALDRADVTGVPVTVLHVVEPGSPERDAAGLEAVVADAAVSHPGLSVSAEAIDGAVVRRLADAPEHLGDLLVVGTHKTGYLQGRVHGSRSVQLAAVMRSHLVVVPDVDLRFRHGVVVGVQDGSESVILGGIAGAEAERCGGDVLAIHAIGMVKDAGTGERRLAGATLLDQARAAAAASGRVVRSRLVERNPLDALLDASRTSALLVIGSSAWASPGRSVTATVHDVLLNVNAPTLVIPSPAGDD